MPAASRPPRCRSCPSSVARSASCSWTSGACSRRAMPTGSGRSPSGGSRTGSSSPRRRVRSTSSGRPSSATWSRGSWCGSTTEACTRSGSSSPRSGRSVCSRSSTSRARIRGYAGGRFTKPDARWRILAREHPADADLVIAVPTTGHSAAQGFSEVSGIPYGDGLYKNTYVGRTFIQPSQSLRDRGVKLKLNPLPDSIRGKRLVVVDDSIVRGTTTKQIVQALREAGAAEIHIRITCPPIQWPCFYGIDMPTRQELIAADLTVDQIRSYVSADSLGYLSLEGMVAAAGDGKETFCRACFDGEYPIDIPEGAGKYVLEDQLKLPTG